jgi:hypothetical protein
VPINIAEQKPFFNLNPMKKKNAVEKNVKKGTKKETDKKKTKKDKKNKRFPYWI